MGTRVLVVEDVPELSRLLEMTLEFDDRFEPVGTATTGDDALRLARDESPGGIVLDLSVEEDGQGIGLLTALRTELPDARIVVFTGQDDPWFREQALASGATDYVLKGGDLQPLLDALDAASA